MTKQTIAVFGGTFNPPTLSHACLIKAVLSNKLADKAVVVVSDSPWKLADPNIVSFEKRLEMASLAFSGMSGVTVSDIERDMPSPHYTGQVLDALRLLHPNDTLRLVIGGDQAARFGEWKEADRIAIEYPIITVPRGDSDRSSDRWLDIVRHYRMEVLDVFLPVSTSSTMVRSKVKTGVDYTGLVRPEIVDFIERNRLYL